jgi:hypothetical protein
LVFIILGWIKRIWFLSYLAGLKGFGFLSHLAGLKGFGLFLSYWGVFLGFFCHIGMAFLGFY